MNNKRQYKKLERITEDGYIRPSITACERLTEDEIKGKLINYKRINSI